MATLFRGYEVIMIGRDPRDAIYITSRACGVCGGVHSVTSADGHRDGHRLRAAAARHPGSQPRARRWSSSTTTRSTCTCWPAPTTPRRWSGPPIRRCWRARRSTEAPHAEIHGFRTIGELMEDLNPLSGKLYLEALHMTRVAREAYVLICGKYPHPQTIVPGGMSSTITLTRHERDVHAAGPVLRLLEEARARSGTTSPSSSTTANPAYKQVGARRANLIDTGIFDHPDAYDATYADAARVGRAALGDAGCHRRRRARHHRSAQASNIGVEEFVEHSYYEEWAGSGQRQRFPTDPARQPALALSPVEQGDQAAAARAELEGEVHLGHGAALGPPVHGGRRLRPAVEHRRRAEAARQPLHRVDGNIAQDAPAEGRAPRDGDRVARARGLERVRAQSRAGVLHGLHGAGRAQQLAGGDGSAQARRHADQHARSRSPSGASSSASASGAPAAATSRITSSLDRGRGRQLPDRHAVDVERLAHRPLAAARARTRRRSSTRRSSRRPTTRKQFKGIDILRAIRSFDPCMPCTTHIHSDAGVITREVNTCACGVDDDGG